MRTTLKAGLKTTLFALLFIFMALPALGADAQARLLLYRVQSSGEEPYFNRLLVTADFLRLDRGERDSGYILFDRARQIIYSIDHEERSILVIDPPALSVDFQSNAPDIRLQPVEPVEAPEVAGIKPRHWRLEAAGRSCREAFVLPGLMPQAVAAYGEYLSVLSRQQAQSLATIPAEFQDACDNAVHIFAADALLQKGLPLDLWDAGGYRESLVDFRAAFTVADTDFSLPSEYSRIPMRSGY